MRLASFVYTLYQSAYEDYAMQTLLPDANQLFTLIATPIITIACLISLLALYRLWLMK